MPASELTCQLSSHTRNRGRSAPGRSRIVAFKYTADAIHTSIRFTRDDVLFVSGFGAYVETLSSFRLSTVPI